MSFRQDTRTDAELLRASRDDGEGFAAFYRRHRDAVLAYHARRVREPELAADLTSETFAAALLAVQDRDRELPEVPLAWLFTIAHRKLVDSYRRRKVENDARVRLAMEPLSLDDEDIERITRTRDTHDLLTYLAGNLPPEQMHALQARVLDEREYREIAAELDCSESLVRMRVSRALAALRLAKEGSDA